MPAGNVDPSPTSCPFCRAVPNRGAPNGEVAAGSPEGLLAGPGVGCTGATVEPLGGVEAEPVVAEGSTILPSCRALARYGAIMLSIGPYLTLVAPSSRRLVWTPTWAPWSFTIGPPL